MAYIDVFNGDADGICALTQLRLAEPRSSQLVTGVKRDIALLQRIHGQAGDEITVLDVSLDKNREDLERILAAGARVFYCDHHHAGEIPDSPLLDAHINTAPDVCTSLLVNGHLGGRFAAWAVVGAFGDNLWDSAARLAAQLDLSEAQCQLLQKLGIYMNYNGYGATVDDLHFAPEELYQRVRVHAHPLEFIEQARADFQRLEEGYQRDMDMAREQPFLLATEQVAVLSLPDAAWARRVSGVYSNELANGSPDRAHAVLTKRPNGSYLVSVRAPLNRKAGADELCREFATGGGRAAAAGINELPAEQLSRFIDRFQDKYR